VRAGNNAADGPFTPIVKIVRNVIGVKEFNQLRGKGISLHSQGEQLSDYGDNARLAKRSFRC
jgi:hypothetical protein